MLPSGQPAPPTRRCDLWQGGSAVTDTEEKGLLESRQPADGVKGQVQQQEEDFWLERTSAQAEVFIKAQFQFA